jgi:four helix bundle protein
MEHPTETAAGRKFDLEERLRNFSTRIIRLAEKMPKTTAGRHVGNQVLRSGTSPYANHGEAEDAESTDDFIHKLKVCLKELRETWRWLRLIQHVPLVQKPGLMDPLIQENDELIRIFYQSIITARRRTQKEDKT